MNLAGCLFKVKGKGWRSEGLYGDVCSSAFLCARLLKFCLHVFTVVSQCFPRACAASAAGDARLSRNRISPFCTQKFYHFKKSRGPLQLNPEVYNLSAGANGTRCAGSRASGPFKIKSARRLTALQMRPRGFILKGRSGSGGGLDGNVTAECHVSICSGFTTKMSLSELQLSHTRVKTPIRWSVVVPPCVAIRFKPCWPMEGINKQANRGFPS